MRPGQLIPRVFCPFNHAAAGPIAGVVRGLLFPLRSLVRCAGWTIAFAMAATLTAQAAGETWRINGREFANVRVSEVTEATVTIFHSGGIAQLDLATLPPELQARFGFDPDKAANWRLAATEGLAATRDTQLRVEAQRLEAAAAARAEVARKSTASLPDDPVTLYPEVDLRPIYQSHGLYLKDQGRRPSCSVFAVVGALEYEIARRGGKAEPLSEEYLIWAVHQLHPGVPLDTGYHFEEVISALLSYGVPPQRAMPNTFGKKTGDIQPPTEAVLAAPALRSVIPVWFRPDDPKLQHRLVDALNRGVPVVIGLRWPHGRTLDGNHLLRDQQPLEGAGHAVTLVGYQCKDGIPENTVFVFRNSYGARWGLGGCGFVATSYLRENLIAAFHLKLPEDFTPAADQFASRAQAR